MPLSDIESEEADIKLPNWNGTPPPDPEKDAEEEVEIEEEGDDGEEDGEEEEERTVPREPDDPIRAEKVVLAIGLQGNIRRLTISGAEDFATLQYELEDPKAHVGETIVVVGAGDAAIENALALAEANQVAIVNRRDEFARAKSGNLAAITDAIDRGAVECYWSSTPERLEDGALVLRTPHGEARVACDRVIARLG